MHPKQAVAAVLLIVAALPATAQVKCVDEAGRVTFQDSSCPKVLNAGRDRSQTAKEQIARVAADERRAAETRRREEVQRGFRSFTEVPSKRIPIPVDSAPSITPAPSKGDVDRMTTYIVALGRGLACGAPGAQDMTKRVGQWMDAQGLGKEYLVVSAVGMKQAYDDQNAGKTPDTCATVRSKFSSFPWP